jgi:thioredoxin 1
MMAPILEELKKEYAGKLQVEFIDVNQNPEAGTQYSIKLIPVQVFFDKDGKEVFRHIGFFPQAEIEKKLAEMGVK